MTAISLFLMSSIVGQYPYVPGGYAPMYPYGYGYYGRTPLQVYDPTRYARFYSGEGYYSYAPPVVANPEVLVPPHTTQTPTRTQAPRQAAASGFTGLVLGVDESRKQITVQLPTSKVNVPYGPTTHFLAADGNFPVIKPGNLISVNQNTITILRRSQQ
jgi:hypothetical protein